jgi:hypothetical protein
MIKRSSRIILRTLAPVLLPRVPGSSLRWGPPRRVSPTVQRWSSLLSDCRLSLHNLIPALQFQNTPATHIQQTLPRNLLTPATINLDSQFVAEIKGGRVVGEEPTIITPDDTVILDLSMFFTPYHHDIFFSPRLPPVVSLQDPVLVLAGLPGSNYGHWLHQMLPRLHLAQMAGWEPSDFGMVIVNPTRNNFAEETLMAAGFQASQLVKSGPNLHVEAPTLVVPSIPSAGNPPEWISDFLRQTYTTPDVQPLKRIYASRANALWRKITNEEDLLPVLDEYGFEVVFPEQLSFRETVQLFQAAEVVCGLHGANLSNICFCNPGATLIEIYHPQHPEIYFWTTATGARLNYAFLLGEGPVRDYPDLSPGSIGNHSDTSVDPEKLRITFATVGLDRKR